MLAESNRKWVKPSPIRGANTHLGVGMFLAGQPLLAFVGNFVDAIYV